MYDRITADRISQGATVDWRGNPGRRAWSGEADAGHETGFTDSWRGADPERRISHPPPLASNVGAPSDRELLRETGKLVRHERHLQGAVIDHLAEIEAIPAGAAPTPARAVRPIPTCAPPPSTKEETARRAATGAKPTGAATPAQ